MTSHLNEDKLDKILIAMQNGDEDAFTRFYNEVYNPLLNSIRAKKGKYSIRQERRGVYPTQDSESVAQWTMATFFEKKHYQGKNWNHVWNLLRHIAYCGLKQRQRSATTKVVDTETGKITYVPKSKNLSELEIRSNNGGEDTTLRQLDMEQGSPIYKIEVTEEQYEEFDKRFFEYLVANEDESTVQVAKLMKEGCTIEQICRRCGFVTPYIARKRMKHVTELFWSFTDDF